MWMCGRSIAPANGGNAMEVVCVRKRERARVCVLSHDPSIKAPEFLTVAVYCSSVLSTASNHVIRNIYNTTKMSTKDSHFRRVWGKFIQISFEA